MASESKETGIRDIRDPLNIFSSNISAIEAAVDSGVTSAMLRESFSRAEDSSSATLFPLSTRGRCALTRIYGPSPFCSFDFRNWLGGPLPLAGSPSNHDGGYGLKGLYVHRNNLSTSLGTALSRFANGNGLFRGPLRGC